MPHSSPQAVRQEFPSRRAPTLNSGTSKLYGCAVCAFLGIVLVNCAHRPAEAPPARASVVSAPAGTASAEAAHQTTMVSSAPPFQTYSGTVRVPRLLPADQRPPQVGIDVARQQASAIEGYQQNRLERLSLNGRPTPFIRENFIKDPEAYLNIVEPCRIWQIAADGPDVDVLTTPEGAPQVHVTVEPDTSFPLQVITWPGYPATFSSYDRGSFANGLTSITVQADLQGIARADFTATPGTTDRVRILAASPVAAGQVEFYVFIPTPAAPAQETVALPTSLSSQPGTTR